MQLVFYFHLYLMLHVYATKKFDVTRNLDNFYELNKSQILWHMHGVLNINENKN